jgi:hypothetical protein
MVIPGKLCNSYVKLSLVVQALRLPACLSGGTQCGEQHRRQNGNDGNHHQQFYQCESALFHIRQYTPPSLMTTKQGRVLNNIAFCGFFLVR